MCFGNMYKHQDVLESNIVIKGIAIVKFHAKKSSCNCFGDSKIHKPANTMKVTNVIKAQICKLLSKVTPKFRAETAG